MGPIAIALAHLGRAAYYTFDNPYLRSVMGAGLPDEQVAVLEAAIRGALDPVEWLEGDLGAQLVEQVGVGIVPRDVQLVPGDDEERVGVESVHAFVRAPLFWWLVSHLWCLEAGRVLDTKLGDRVFGYRLRKEFIDKPEASPMMFGPSEVAYQDWRRSATDMSRQHVNRILATSTLDLRAFYYSVTASPSEIVEAFSAGAAGGLAVSGKARILTQLLDALHGRYAAEASRVDPRPAAPSGALPLPVGLPSSQILANMVVAVAMRDLEALPDVVGVSAYADDLIVVSRELQHVDEGFDEYFARLGVLERDGERLMLATSAGQGLAYLQVSTSKSGMSYSRVQAVEEQDEPGAQGPVLQAEEIQPEEIDPYVTGQPSSDWGGRLRTVLHSPFKRDRVPRELGRDLVRIADEIRVGVEPADAQAQLDPLVASLNQGDFLALRPYWPVLIACSWYAGGGDAIDGLNRTLDEIVGTLDGPPNGDVELVVAIRAGLRDAWKQALTEALAVLGAAGLAAKARPSPLLVKDATGEGIKRIALRARLLRKRRFVNARFVSVPLAEFSSWPGPLFGARAFRDFLGWAQSPEERRVPDLRRAKRFVPLHEVCVAEHLWVAPRQSGWLTRVFALLGGQPLVDPEMVRDLRRRARGMTSNKSARNERAANIDAYSLRIAIPSMKVVGARQLEAAIADDHAALSEIARVSRARVTKVVNSASKRRADLLVLPEWAVTRAQLTWLLARSAKSQMLVVAGEAPSINNGVYSNRVWTGLPFVDRMGHRACLVPPPREKRYLSPVEASAVSRGGFKRYKKRQAVSSYAWRGINIASLICFEFADVSARERLRSKADLITVSSWNTDWRYFAAAQEATTRDNYCVSLCVNTSDFPGTTLMRPTRSAMAIAAAVHGSSYPTVVTRDVDMLPIVVSRTVGRRPSEMEGLLQPSDGLQLEDYTAVPPMFGL